MHQSLAPVPSAYSDIIALMDEEKKTKILKSPARDKETVQMDTSSRPNVIMHSSEAKLEALKENDLEIETLLREKTSISRGALQRSLGRWSNATLFLSSVRLI